MSGIAMARLRLLDEPEKLNSAGVQVHVTGIGWAGGFGEPADSITELKEVPAPSGTAMAMRAETFRELGGFAEELFMYIEDLELGWRARIAGYRVVVDPEADVLHEYEFGRNPRKNYLLERNRLVFVLSSYSGRQLILLGPLLAATELGDDGARDQGGLARRQALRLGLARPERPRGRAQPPLDAGAAEVRDRELARYLTPVFDPQMIPVPALLRAANPLVARYWSLVRRAL